MNTTRKCQILTFLLMLVSLASAQTTANLHLNVPNFNAVGWDVSLNQNFSMLDSFLSGGATLPAFKTSGITITGDVLLTGHLNLQALSISSAVCTDSSGNLSTTGCAGGGTVTTVSDLSPLFTVSNRTTTPTFVQSTFAGHKFYGNNTGSTAAPGAVSIGTGDLPFTYGGNTTAIATLGTFSGGLGALVCKDASGNLTTTGCSTAGGGAIVGSPAGGVNQTVTQASSTNLFVNRFENAKFSDQFGSVGAAAADCSGPCVVYVTANDSECNSTIPANVTIIGYGVGATTISCATANQPVFNVTGSAVEIYDLTVKHITNSPTSGGDGIVTCNGCDRIKIQNVRTSFNWNGLKLGYLSYGEVNNIISERNNNDGVLFVTDGVAAHQPQWEVRGGISQQNGGAGFEYTNSTNSLQTTCPHFSGWVATFGNQGPGFLLQATGTSAGIADCLMDGILASQNNDSGIRISPGTAGARNIMVSNVYAEQAGTFTGTQGFSGASASATNIGYGVELLSGTNDNPPNVSNITTWDNSFSGLYLGSAGTVATNIQCFKNGLALSSNAYQRACVTIRSNEINVSNVYSKDSSSTMTNGIEISNSADLPFISGNNCNSSVSSCLTITTAPPNGFRGWYSSSGAPSGACQKGALYTRNDSTGGLYVCVNGTWQQVTIP